MSRFIPYLGYPILKCITLLLLFIAMASLFSSPAFSQSQYPDWFLHPQQYPQLMIGYSMDKRISATQDAVWRYSIHKDGFITGQATFFNDEDKWEKKYSLEASRQLLNPNALVGIARIPTSMYGGGEEIVLFKLKGSAFDPVGEFELVTPQSEMPNWTFKGSTFREGAYIYGVGKYVLRGLENDAWRSAEERAITQIINSVALKVENSIHSRETGSSQNHALNNYESIKILTYEYNHRFKDAEVLERWIDYRHDEVDAYISAYIYVLMRIHRNQVYNLGDMNNE